MAIITCAVAICHIEEPNKPFDVKYAPYCDISVAVPTFDKQFAIDYLNEKYEYPEGTVITVTKFIPLDSFADFAKYIG